MYNFLGHVSLSYAVAFIFNLAFEVPILALEEMVFPTHGKKKKSKSQEEIVKSETIRTDPDGQHQQKQQVPLLSAQTSL